MSRGREGDSPSLGARATRSTMAAARRLVVALRRGAALVARLGSCGVRKQHDQRKQQQWQ